MGSTKLDGTSGGQRSDLRSTPAVAVDLALLARLARPHRGDGPEDTGRPSMRATVTNELELEAARLRSLESSSVPPALRAPAPPSSISDAVSVEEVGWAPHPLSEMRDREAAGDYEGALQLAEALLLDDPSGIDAAELRECAALYRDRLAQVYEARLAPLERVPTLVTPRSEIPWLSLDRGAGFVIPHIDGISSLQVIVDASGMPRLEALRVLCDLVERRIVSLGT